MQITLTTSSSHPQKLQLEYPRGFTPDGPLARRNTTSTAQWGNMEIQECWFEGACLFCSNFKVKGPARIGLHCDSFCWLMNFVLEGGLTSHTVDADLQFGSREYHTFYCSSLDMELAVERDTRVFTICLSRRFIHKLLGSELLPEQFEAGGPEPLTLVASDKFTNNRVAQLISEIMQAAQPEYIQRIFLEAKILELLSLQLEMLERKAPLPAERLPEKDIARLQMARNIVEANIKTPCSLIELARETGLNDFKLKKGFKALFGNTVFGYLTEIRMEKAYTMLLTGTTIAEVAEAVGYKNPHHFTAAFKKRYQILPSKLAER